MHFQRTILGCILRLDYKGQESKRGGLLGGSWGDIREKRWQLRPGDLLGTMGTQTF